jgi:hypothetical protein
LNPELVFAAESRKFNSVGSNPDADRKLCAPSLKETNHSAFNLSLSGTARILNIDVGIAPDAIKSVAFSDKTACRSKYQHNPAEADEFFERIFSE